MAANKEQLYANQIAALAIHGVCCTQRPRGAEKATMWPVLPPK